MSKERVITSYTDNKFLNVPSNSLFTYGSFTITSNFDSKVTKDFENKLISFVTPITLETIGLISTQSDLVTNKTNSVLLNLDRTDLNTFVKFGSAYEFLRISLENIILAYPCSLYFDSQRNTATTVFNYSYDSYNKISTLYLAGDKIVNKFGLIYNSNDLAYETGKEIKNLNNSYSNYVLWFPISANTSYNIVGFTGKTNTQNWLVINVSGEVFPNGISTKLDLHIKPKDAVFNEFLILLSYYEKYVLSQRNGTSNFSFKLKDPTLQEDGSILYIDTNLYWNTKDGYNIDIDTIEYQRLLDILLTIGNKFDSIKTDLIGRFLSPSSLKAYDLTDEGKITKLLRIYGYEFDKLREFIDSMVTINKVSYNKINNVPDQLVSNLSKVLGWNYSTVVNANDFVSNVLNVDTSNVIQDQLTPSEIDIELWRRILINTNYFWKSKGTRESIKSLLLLLGIPEQFINITEYIYTVDGKINPNEAILVPVDYPTNSLPYDDLGYPKAVLETNDFFFQISGDTDSGQAYMNTFRTAGFNLNLTVDNKKSWVQMGETIRTGNTTPSYFQQDSKLVLNTKEIDLSLDTIQGVEKEVYNYLIANPSGFTDNYGVGDISKMSFLEFVDNTQKRLINAKNRKTVSDFKGGWYPALYKIYNTYIGSPSGYTYDLVYSFISKYSEIFDNFVTQVIPATVIIRSGGFIIRDSVFDRQKFMYRRGTYMGVVGGYGGLTGKTTYIYDANLQYLGDDGAVDARLQYDYTSSFDQNFKVCQVNTGNTTTIYVPTTTGYIPTTTGNAPTPTTSIYVPIILNLTYTYEDITTPSSECPGYNNVTRNYLFYCRDSACNIINAPINIDISIPYDYIATQGGNGSSNNIITLLSGHNAVSTNMTIYDVLNGSPRCGCPCDTNYTLYDPIVYTSNPLYNISFGTC